MKQTKTALLFPFAHVAPDCLGAADRIDGRHHFYRQSDVSKHTRCAALCSTSARHVAEGWDHIADLSQPENGSRRSRCTDNSGWLDLRHHSDPLRTVALVHVWLHLSAHQRNMLNIVCMFDGTMHKI